MKDRSEAMRLVLTALGAGLCGAFGYGAIAHREGPPALAPVLDIAPLVAAVQDLQRTLRTAPLSAADVALPTRSPVVDAVDPPTPGAPASGDLDAAIARFTTAVQRCSERLEKLETDSYGRQMQAQLVEEMARLPVTTTPPRWEALQPLIELGSNAMREVGYVTPAEVLQRFGGPSASELGVQSPIIKWSYYRAGGQVTFRFFAGRVVNVEANR